MRWAVPWLASRLAGVLLFTPTYGIGVAVSPLTLLGSWIVVPARTSLAVIRVGSASNMFLIVTGLSLLTVVWVPTGLFWLGIAWLLVVPIMVLAYTPLDRRGRARRQTRTSVRRTRPESSGSGLTPTMCPSRTTICP